MHSKTKDTKSASEYFSFIIIISVILFRLLLPGPLNAEEKFTLLLTSNLQGRFSGEIDNQNKNDPMLLLAQSIIKEKDKSNFDLYLDLGNSFYPGTLSKFSYGSVMIDFFSFFDCAATLVSSRDISIGLSNLEFLSKGRSTKLLSANITRDGQPVFTPYLVVKHGGRKIGFIGITSAEGIFDAADKKVLNISFREYRESIKERAEMLKGEGCDSLILLSGLSYRNNMELMKSIPEVNLIISGGDSSGNIFSVPASRVDLEWGRSVVSLTESDGYYKLDLDLAEGARVRSMTFSKSAENKTTDSAYAEFESRLSLWKKKFNNETNILISENVKSSFITDETAANMLRHRYRTEIGVIEKNSIVPQTLSGSLYYSTILTLVNNDYPLFIYRLSGVDLKAVDAEKGELIIAGLEDGKVQNYTVEDGRTYSICSTQLAYDRITRILRKHVEYTNTWTTLEDEIGKDMKSDQSLTRNNFKYLDDRFRVLIDISLSNFYDNSVVERKGSITTPPGKPEVTYLRWGMEDTVNLTVYNKSHQLILTPYIYYIKQDEGYLQNLLRGTLLYTCDPNSIVRPYQKSQIDTVLVEVNGRPILARETAGVSLKTERLNGKFGAGFEKQFQYPENPMLYGIETIFDANFPFADDLLYTLKLDSFISFRNRTYDEAKIRTEITNALTYKINSLLGFSLKYKWFYLYSRDFDEHYKYSQTLFSIDLKTDFKLF